MKRYLVSGFIVFLFVLIATFPARVAYNWLALPDVTLNGMSGSIWNGNATEGLAAGAYIRDLSWQLKPLMLFTGKLAFAVSGKPASGTVTAEVAVSLDRSLTFSSLAGNLPLDLLHKVFQESGISGDVRLNFATLVLRDGILVYADGNIIVENLFVAELSAAQLGDFRADIQTNDAGIRGSLEDISGVLDVTGVVSLTADHSYSVIGEVAAKPGAPPSISEQLRYLGSPNERGLRQFRLEGEF
jgi:general secretion pathway protein N